jgi:hypothetical protein
MIPLLIGLICFWAAWRSLRPDPARPEQSVWQRIRTGPRAAAWVGAIGALVLLQFAVRADAIARYRFSLVGLRFGLTDEQARPIATPLRVSGDYDEADLFVPGAGATDVAHIRPTGDTSGSVMIDFREDAGALALVEQRLPLARSRWRLPSAVRLEEGDTVVVRARGAIHRLVLRIVPDTLQLPGFGVPLPWADRHVFAKVAEDGVVRERILPSSGVGFAQRLRGARPSLFARTWPLADVLEALDTAAVWGLPPLTSFFFYEGDALLLADVDSEVELARASAVASAAAVADGGVGRTGRRLLIAALPLRDYPELRLTLPERYGIRPLRTVALAVRDEFLDVTYASPEVQALDRDALDEIRLPGAEAEDAYRIRVSHALNPLVRQAVVFESPSRVFSAASQAVLTLDANPRAPRFDIVTPAGLANAETGRPVPLGSRERSILLRVDGQATSPLFWAVHLALFALAGCVFWFRRLPAPVFALALSAIGIAAVRLLLGAGAMLEYPFVQEGHQIGLWLLPVLPWAIVLAAELGRGDGADAPLAFHGAFALGIVTLTLVVFADSPAKQVVLSLAPLALLALAAARSLRTRPRVTVAAAAARAPEARPARPRARATWRTRLAHGWSLGLALLLLRVLLDLVGWREGILIGGTRIAVSVLYTPLALGALALTLHRHGRRIADAPGGRARDVLIAFADTAALIGLAFAGTAFWISDFGIALVGVPGVLLVLALLGARWTRGLGPAAAATFALPLVLFVLAQSAPQLLRPVWLGGARAEGRLGEWNRNELLLLERGDPHALRRIGQRRSEALAVMRETMRSYTRGNWLGRGFLEGRVSNEIQDTATREHAVSALLASQWGLAGVLGLVLLLVAVPLPLARSGTLPRGDDGRRVLRAGLALFVPLFIAALVLPSPFGALLTAIAALAAAGAFAASAWNGTRQPPSDATPGDESMQPGVYGTLAALLLLTFACSGLYMVLANYGLTFFTGKNVYLLGLDSVSDALEGGVLLAGAAWALARAAPRMAAPAAAAQLPRREVLPRTRTHAALQP